MQTALSAKFLNLAFHVAGVPGVSLLWEISAQNSDSDNPPQCQKTPGAGEETAKCPTTLRTKGGVRGVPAEHPIAISGRGRNSHYPTENINILI